MVVVSAACGSNDPPPPRILSYSPLAGAIGVPLNAGVMVEFNQQMIPLDGEDLTLFTGSTQVFGVVQASVDKRIFTLVPSNPLMSGTVYTASIPAGLVAFAGQSLAEAQTWTFTTETGPDILGPLVTSTSPGINATGVSLNSAVTATFNEDIAINSVNASSVTVTQGATALTGSVTLSAPNVIRFVPEVALAGGTLYSVSISPNLRDASGNLSGTAYMWSFTTGVAPDTEAPFVSSTNPSANETGLGLNATLAVAFSEAMDPGTITAATFTLVRGTTPVNGVISFGTVSTTIFTPSSVLLPNTIYTATLSTAVSDSAGNSLESAFIWSFTTGAGPDVTSPVVSSTDPASNATGIAVNSTVLATFSEAVSPATVTPLSFTLMRGTTAVAGSVTIGPANAATFTPSADLLANTSFVATITTAVKDLAGNSLASIYSWSFTTGNAPDTTAPVVSSTVPLLNATNVGINSTVAATFSESINPTSVTPVSFRLSWGTTNVAGSIAIGPVNVVTFSPTNAMFGNTVYTATLTTAVKDLAGNALAANYTWSFTTGAAPDTIAPVPSSTNPGNSATGVAVNSTIAASFSEAIKPSSLTPLTFTLMRGTTAVTGTIAVGPVNTATFTPSAVLLGNTVYTATLTTGVQDLAGNPLAANYTWTFTTGTAPDTTAPVVSSTDPASNATAVAVNANVAATFSEAVSPTTVTPVTFTLMRGTTAVAGTISIGPVNTVIFNPTAALLGNTLHTATLTTGVKDLAGNALAANYTWTFTTGTAPDTTAPVVSTTSPIANATGVAVNATVAATFSEAINPTTVTTLSFTLMRGATAVTGTIAVGPVNTVTFTPSAAMLGNTVYTATLSTAIKDLAGNSLASALTWSFTTRLAPDTTAPVVSSTNPLNNATGVAVNATVAAVFSEAVNPTTVTPLTFTLMRGATAVTGTIAIGPVNTATFTPSAALLGSTLHTATLTTGIKDLAGNALAITYTWTFTTGVAPDTTPPVVSSTNPLNNATGVAVNTTVAATFSEAINPTTVTPLTFTFMQGAVAVPGSIAVGPANTVTFTPTAVLASFTVYTGTLTTGVKDLAGNALAANHVWSFTTGLAPDIVAPVVSSTNPINNATGVAVNATVIATFSEAVNPTTITPLTFTLKRGAIDVVGTIAVGPVNAATFTPSAALLGNTLYTATLTVDIEDLAGNNLATPFTWSFTTGVAPDTTPPVVSSTNPLNNAVGVAVNATVAATFSEAMDPATITPLTFTLKQGATAVPGTIAFGPVTATTFTPSSVLLGLTVYTASFTTGVKDLAGNSLAAVYTWSFTTGVAPDIIAPVISSRTPLNNATGVATNATVAVTFSEAMSPASITPLSFFVKNGAVAVPGTILVSPVNTATFTPTVNLLGNTLYTVTVTTDVEDLAFNNLALQSVWTFTTGAAPDITRPTVVSTVPLAASTGIAVNTTVVVNFSEPMDPATITPLTFTLMQGLITIPGTITFGPLNTATFTPTVLLAGNQLHSATLTTGVKDLAGNSLLNQFDWSFTTGTAPDITPPIVASTNPLNSATNIVVNTTVEVVFDEAMMASSLTPLTFTLRRGAVNVPGTVGVGPATTATFTPDDVLIGSTLYTASLSTDVKDLAGNSLANVYNWTFTTGVVPALGPAPVSLGTAGGFAILAKTGISTVPQSAITGHIGVSPIAAAAITGFSLTQDPSNVFSTSTQVTGQVFAANYAVPTPTNLTTAISNLETAYTDAAGRPTPDSLNLLGGAIGGQTLVPGLYKWGSSVGMAGHVTLSGAPDDVWIFQISGNLTMATSVQIIMAGGAKPKNVFWQVAGLCDFGAGSHFEGILLCSTQVTLQTGATMTGRILAQTFVALQQATVTQPGN